jgi:(p)ppGpp synthase/HD superfamily hydrolase
VARICVEEIGLGVRSTICSLLHDTVEDTDISLDDIQREFGSEIGPHCRRINQNIHRGGCKRLAAGGELP